MSPILWSFGIVMVVAIIVWWMMEKVSGRIEESALAHPAWDKRPFLTPRRVGKLVIAFFVIGTLGAIPGAVIQIWVASQEADKPDTKQEQINRTMKDAREAVRQGKAGKAFQRLFPEGHQEYLRKQQAAERASAAKLGSQIDQEVTIEGIAVNSKAGAEVQSPGAVVIVLLEQEWPPEVLGKKVRARGILRKKKLLPDPDVGPVGAIPAEAIGEQYFLENPRWGS